MATATTGMISDVTTVRAWTGVEFKAIAEKAEYDGWGDIRPNQSISSFREARYALAT